MTDPGQYTITLELDETGVQKAALSPLEVAATLAEKSTTAINAGMAKIQEIGALMAQTLQAMAKAPTSASVEFGLKLGGEVGFIAKGSGEAHFVVKLEWKHRSEETSA